jgi:hypothetical protein
LGMFPYLPFFENNTSYLKRKEGNFHENILNSVSI